MKVQLKQRWASYLPGAIVSVSLERGRYLVQELRVGKDVDCILSDALAKKKKGKK